MTDSYEEFMKVAEEVKEKYNKLDEKEIEELMGSANTAKVTPGVYTAALTATGIFAAFFFA